MTVTNGKTSDIKLLTKVTVMALQVHIILEIINQWKLKKPYYGDPKVKRNTGLIPKSYYSYFTYDQNI